MHERPRAARAVRAWPRRLDLVRRRGRVPRRHLRRCTSTSCTLGVAAESLARRLIPTIGWLAIGLALFIAARSRASAPGRVGVGFVAVAVLKALIYDSTHLQGPLRVTVFAAVGVLLLAGARLTAVRERT